jgi:hypothetical protein
VIEIEFAAGGRMRITGAVDASTVSAQIRTLKKASGSDDPDPERHPGVAVTRRRRLSAA